MGKEITLAYGGGGEETQKLIKDLFYRYFENPILLRGEDSGILPPLEGEIAFTTDGFTISPLFFNGGNIGKLAVVGTANDLAMAGAKPRYLTGSFMIEEGLEWETLEKIVQSMGKVLKEEGILLVGGDTKVVPKGSVDKLFISTSGIGEIRYRGISASNLQPGDKIVISGEIGRHGAVILAHRYGVETDLTSDCAPLWERVEKLIGEGIKIKALRDATRGGLSALLNEWAEASGVEIGVEEEKISVPDGVMGLCELFGFDPLDLANEGTFAVAVAPEDATRTREILRLFNPNAQIIGEVREGKGVVLESPWGTSRYLELPKGELLPRIC